MCSQHKEPHKVIRVGGRVFRIYTEYDEELGESYPVYPDFEKSPEYTDEGRPFATAESESCQYKRPNASGKPCPSDCGGCGWFFREQTSYDPIGICMCDARRRVDKAVRKERET